MPHAVARAAGAFSVRDVPAPSALGELADLDDLLDEAYVELTGLFAPKATMRTAASTLRTMIPFVFRCCAFLVGRRSAKPDWS